MNQMLTNILAVVSGLLIYRAADRFLPFTPDKVKAALAGIRPQRG